VDDDSVEELEEVCFELLEAPGGRYAMQLDNGHWLDIGPLDPRFRYNHAAVPWNERAANPCYLSMTIPWNEPGTALMKGSRRPAWAAEAATTRRVVTARLPDLWTSYADMPPKALGDFLRPMFREASFELADVRAVLVKSDDWDPFSDCDTLEELHAACQAVELPPGGRPGHLPWHDDDDPWRLLRSSVEQFVGVEAPPWYIHETEWERLVLRRDLMPMPWPRIRLRRALALTRELVRRGRAVPAVARRTRGSSATFAVYKIFDERLPPELFRKIVDLVI